MEIGTLTYRLASTNTMQARKLYRSISSIINFISLAILSPTPKQTLCGNQLSISSSRLQYSPVHSCRSSELLATKGSCVAKTKWCCTFSTRKVPSGQQSIREGLLFPKAGQTMDEVSDVSIHRGWADVLSWTFSVN